MVKRLAINTDGVLTYCSAPEDKIGVGRCNHTHHQQPDESRPQFIKRASTEIERETRESSSETTQFVNKISKLWKDDQMTDIAYEISSAYSRGDHEFIRKAMIEVKDAVSPKESVTNPENNETESGAIANKIHVLWKEKEMVSVAYEVSSLYSRGDYSLLRDVMNDFKIAISGND